MKNESNKIVIIGAGHVGSHCGLSLMMQGLATEIVYIDIDKNKAAMQALDLDDMASNLDRDFTVRAGDYSDCADAHIVVMAAGKSRLPGQTRLDMFDRRTVKRVRIPWDSDQHFQPGRHHC